MSKLTQPQIDAALCELSGWTQKGETIEKEYQFVDFALAIAFVNRVAEMAEEADHHPDIDIRYNKVLLSLSTHSEGGITPKDVQLAGEIEEIVGAAGEGEMAEM